MARVAEVAIEVLIAVLFLGWMLTWIVLPTNVYMNDWSPKIISAIKFTYFGTLGESLLIHALPIFFIAVLGCVYLHLKKNRRKTSYMRSGTPPKIYGPLAVLKRPVLVRGPLGIVSSLELAFFVMFIALVVWSLSFFISSGFSRLEVKEGDEVWEAKLYSVGLKLGLVGNICLAFLFFPITRFSSLLPLVGLTSESSVKYHVWMGHITLALFTTHAALYVIYWASIDKVSEMVRWPSSGEASIAGELSILSGLIMWATTFPSIRRKAFEVFFYTHQLYVLFLVFFAFHVGMVHFFWNLPGVYLFLLDRYLRFLQSRSSIRLLSARVLPSSFELNFAKDPGFDYAAMSVIFLNVPSVSKLQWHPFTVSSSSGLEPNQLSIVIKKEGKWSTKLHDLLSSNSPPDRLQLSVEGPYGHISDHFLKYNSLVLVSGGSGITPFIAIIRELLHIATTSPTDRPIPDVHVICTFKNSDDLAMLDLLLPLTGNYTADLSRLPLRIDAFVTREKGPTSAVKKRQPRIIWFNPLAFHSSIVPVLGPNGWLWLAAIISSSFVAFLILVGILTRYYLYPREKDHQGRHTPTKVTLIMLFMCISIALAGGVAVVWHKLHAKREIQVQAVAGATPLSSPAGTPAYNTDTELESLPPESFAQATTVQYGTRPDLETILLGGNGSTEPIGVYVSGPFPLRREVALICASGLKTNLHFESVSFSW